MMLSPALKLVNIPEEVAMITYEIKLRYTNHPGAIGVVVVEAFDHQRNSNNPSYEASWKADGTPFGAYRLKEDDSLCEGCEHSDIPILLYMRFIEEMERVANTIKFIVAKVEGSETCVGS